MINRRDAIKRLGGLAGAATMAKVLPGCDDGPSVPDHPVFVYLMLENRTYDHVLGARKLLHGLPGDGLAAGMKNLDMNGTTIAPFEPTLDEMCVFDPPHGWDASHLQWNAGKNDGFVTQYQATSGVPAHAVMQYLTDTQVPITWALADAYTTCDHWFASVMGPTLPNRAYWHTATSFGLKDNNAVINAFSAVPVPTIYNRLHDKNVEWVYYF